VSTRLARRPRVTIAAAAAASLVVTPLAALATETPPATPEAISAEESEDTDGEQPLPLPTSNEFALGQSLQIRVGPDGEPNSSLLDFRWSVNQLTVQGPGEGAQEVPVPDRGDLIRSLLDFSNPPQEDGIATLTADMANGYGLARTVSLFPQDEEPPIELTASFTLDGQPIDPWDLVGESGDVTATYTLTNTSTQEMEVEVENLAGEPVTQTVQADVPMVGITKVLLPQRFTGLNLKGGTFGADGRGNNQVQFISLPFRPISEDGTATFGWSARVEDAVIPSMVVQVAPIYIPEDDPDTPQDESRQGGGLVSPPPNLDPAVSQIQQGISEIITGVDLLTADSGGPDPLTELEGRLDAFFTRFGVNITEVGQALDPNNPESATALLVQLQGALQRIEEQNLLARLDEVASLLTPEVAQTLFEASDPIQAVADNAELLNQIAGNASSIQAVADNAGLIATGIRAGCLDPPGPAEPSLPPEVCDNQDALIAILQSTELQQFAALVNSQEFQLLADLAASEQFQLAAQVLEQLGPNIVPLAEALQVANTQLPGIVTTLTPIADALVPALTDLSNQITVLGEGLAEVSPELPTVDQVVANITSAILESPGGQSLTSGLDNVGGGIGSAKSLLGDWLAETIATLQVAASSVGSTVENVDETVVTLKAEVGGLLMAAHQSPLPYGGDPANAPADTVLAGAYEFRVDAADTNQPYTGPRVLVGLIALVGAGALSYFVGRPRGEAAGEDGAEQPEEPPEEPVSQTAGAG
jgi:hypothetical protein